MIVAAATLLFTIGLAACGSSPTASGALANRTCKQVQAVLSDGPQSAADPVGYAQAQVLPLRQIHTADEKLRRAIDKLASAYQAFFQSNGASATNAALRSATETIQTLCPRIEP
jgi:hypothetical protein